MELSPSSIEHLLDTWPVARLATVGTGRAPQLVPVVFASAGAALWSPIDGKPKRGGELQRVRNVRINPEVGLLLDHYEADWEKLWWLRIEGLARIVQPALPAEDPLVKLAVDALRRKYPQYTGVPLLRDPPTLLAIEPVEIRSWCASAEAIPWP